MSCHHEHNEDDHLAPPDTNEAQTLYPYIDIANVQVLNATNSSDAGSIVRSYQNRLEETPILESEADEELLISIPFTGEVRLHSILFRSIGDETSPAEISLFKNSPQLDFDQAGNAHPVQVLQYPAGVGLGISTAEGTDGIVQFALNRPKFMGITSLQIYITKNHGADETKLTYVGLRGTYTKLNKAPIVVDYEAAANPADHKTEVENLTKNSNFLG